MPNTTNTTYTFSGLKPSTLYRITVKAKDLSGNLSSGVYIDQQTVADATAPVLTITPATQFTNNQTVTMTTNETSTIWYTVDGTDPITSGTRTQYTTTITITGTTTLKAYAVDTTGNASAVQTVLYEKVAFAPTGHVTSGLTAYFDFRTLSSTPATVTDLSGNGNDGTVSGGSVADGALTSTGTSKVIIPKTNLIAYPFTLEFYSQILQPTTGTFQRFFDINDSTGTGNGLTLGYHNSTSGTPNELEVGGKFGQPSFRYQKDLTQAYNHIVVTWDGTAQNLYIDGVLVKSNSQTSTTLGAREIWMLNWTKTKVFRLYNRLLTASEVTQNYNQAKQ